MKEPTRGRVFLHVAAVLSLLFFVVGSATAADTIKIGGLFELTGFLAPIGGDAHRGAQIAIEQEGGKLLGKPLEFIAEDTATDVSVTMDKARKLVEIDKVKVVVGPIFGSSTGALGGYADKMQIPVISIASLNLSTLLQNQWCFSITGTNESMGYPMGVYAAEKMGIKSVATIGSDFDAGHEFVGGFVQGFQSKGGKVLQQQWSPPGSTNMMPFLIATDNKADGLVVWWPGAEAFAGFRAFKELNIKKPIMEPEDGGILGNPVANKGLGEGAIGAHTTVMYSYLANVPGNKEFVAAYKKKYGVVPGPLAGCGYISAKTAIEGLKRAGVGSSRQEAQGSHNGAEDRHRSRSDDV